MIDEKMVGTPKDLDELVLHVFCTSGKNFRQSISLCIRDYLARKFNTAMLANPEATQILVDLFKSCIHPIE